MKLDLSDTRESVFLGNMASIHKIFEIHIATLDQFSKKVGKYGIKNFLYCLLYRDKSEATDKNNTSNERIFHTFYAKILKNLMIKDSEAIKLT